MKHKLTKLFLVVITVGITQWTYANDTYQTNTNLNEFQETLQPLTDNFGPGGGPVGPDPGSPPADAIPIDGGLSWLLAAGGIYGVSKIRKNFKK